jgi:hypothetical protein
MPDANLTPLEVAWLDFVNNLSDLLAIQPDDRPLDQYLRFRDEVLALVKSDEFLQELKVNWPSGAGATVQPVPDKSAIIANLVVLELDSSARAIEVAKTLPATDPERKEWFRKLLGRGSTVTGSVKDILEHVLSNHPLLKGGLTVFRELLDLFK